MCPEWRPRGQRNKNPFNVKFNPANSWKGAVPRAQKKDQTFEEFTEVKWGIRCGVYLLLKHFKGDMRRRIPPCDTIRKLITEWAPPEENDTEAYIARVCAYMGKGDEELIDFREYKHMLPLCEAMIGVELGVMPYKLWELQEGIREAGIKVPRI